MKIELDKNEIETIIGALQNMCGELELTFGIDYGNFPFQFLRMKYLDNLCDKLRKEIE